MIRRKEKVQEDIISSFSQQGPQGNLNHGRIVSMPGENRCLDTLQLHRLEQSFRTWTESSTRADVRLARQRVLLIFLLIRYTGAKLSEVLAIHPDMDIDTQKNEVAFRDPDDNAIEPRRVQISDSLSREIMLQLSNSSFRDVLHNGLDVDPGFVRRKFYERAETCGFPKELAGPEMIRKARAVELMQGNLPLPAVQKLLGHSTPNLTSSYVSFSEAEIEQVTKSFIDRESSRKTSARNTFFGKVQTIQKGDIQTRVILTTASGCSVTTVITNDSLERLALKEGRLITAEVKAPWVILLDGETERKCSAENRFFGVVEKVNKGRISTEYTVRIDDGTALCAVASTQSIQSLSFQPGEWVWVLFNCFAVVLNAD